jgi:hypothetical protein
MFGKDRKRQVERRHNGQQRIRQSASKPGEQYESQAVFLLAGKLRGA